MESVTSGLNEKIVDHFLNPRNVGEIENANGYAKIGDSNCGDYINVWLRIENDIIVDFKYKVFGCWGVISTTSVVSELALGKSLNEAIQLTAADVIRALEGIPEQKHHCSLLGIQGLHTAIADYLLKENHQKYLARLNQYRSNGYNIPAIREKMVRLVSDLFDGAKILDVGCGKGHLALAIAQSGKTCTAIDVSADEVYYARLNAIYFNVDHQIDFQIQDANKLEFESQFFDVVFSAALFHHLPDPELVLNEMLRVCKSPGKIIISDLNEPGRQVVATVLCEENRVHQCIGWSCAEIKSWFENKGFHPAVTEGDCEIILDIKI